MSDFVLYMHMNMYINQPKVEWKNTYSAGVNKESF